MSRRRIIPLGALLILAFALTLERGAPAVVAQSGGGYDLSWSAVTGGGATYSSGSAYAMSGAIVPVGSGGASGGSYSMAAGFFNGITDMLKVFLPAITKDFSVP
ncbi:MAG: hypothetical protein HY259_11885 [Chloroflexi bacterium]|nr:hypothetical protein [Chloroflexota bacterium]MBI3734136.1 hypothetical protein [Chloroflexota bacterium]